MYLHKISSNIQIPQDEHQIEVQGEKPTFVTITTVFLSSPAIETGCPDSESVARSEHLCVLFDDRLMVHPPNLYLQIIVLKNSMARVPHVKAD